VITLMRTTEVVPLTDHPDAEVVVIEAPVNARRFNTLAHRVFDALGQTSAATGNRVTATRHQVPLLTVALMSRPVRVLVVDHVERCGVSSLTHLIHTTISSGVELVAVAHPPMGDHLERTFAAWPQRRGTHQDLTARLSPTTKPENSNLNHSPAFPAVPDAEFPHFLAECRRTLPAHDYGTVDAEYRRVLVAVRTDVEREPTGSAVLESLRRHMRDATSDDHAITITRAGTAAAFPSGLFTTCSADQLRSTITAEPYFRARVHPDWEALHTYRRPERAAAAVLATLGLTAAQMCELTVSDADDLETQVPPAARVHLRRTVLHREISGAAESDPLLTLADGRPVNTRWVRETLLDIGRTTGLPADRQRRRPIRESEYQWAARLGIRVRSL